MAKQMYVDLDFQGSLKILNAELENIVPQITNDIAALTTTFQGDNTINTKNIFVFDSSTKRVYVWNGGGPTGTFESYGSNVTEVTVRGGLDQASTVISGTTITDGTLTYDNIKNGHTFVFNGAGGPATLPSNLGGEQVATSDKLIFVGVPAGIYATNGELTTAANWMALQGNTDAATETSLGLVSLASDAEVKAGSQGSPAPTVVQSNQIAQRQYVSGTLNPVADTPLTVTHNLGTQNITVVVKRVTGGAIIETNVVIVDNNEITIEVNLAVSGGVIAYVSSW